MITKAASILLAKGLGALALTLALSGGIYGLKNYVENIGYSRAKQEDALIIKKLEDDAEKKFNSISVNSNVLATELKISIEALQNDIASIVKASKGKSFVIVKNGECSPSTTFSDTFNQINKRVNENNKEVKP